MSWNFWNTAVFLVQKSWRRSVGFKRKILRRENKFSNKVDHWAAQYWTANVFLFRKVEYEGRFILAFTAFLHFVTAIFHHVYVKLDINKVQNLFMNILGECSPWKYTVSACLALLSATCNLSFILLFVHHWSWD